MRLAHMVKIQDRPVSSCNIHFLNLQTFLSHLSFNWVLKNSKPYNDETWIMRKIIPYIISTTFTK